MSKNLLVAAVPFMFSPFTQKRVLKGQQIEIPKIDDRDPDRDGKLAEIERIKARLIEDGKAEMSDTAIGPYSPGVEGAGGTEGIHFNIPEKSVQHDGTPESAARIQREKIEADKISRNDARKAEQAEKDAEKKKIDDAKAADDKRLADAAEAQRLADAKAAEDAAKDPEPPAGESEDKSKKGKGK